MKIGIFSFTEAGRKVEETIKEILSESSFRNEDFIITTGCRRDDAPLIFKESDALIFVGAAGIAMRTIGPLLEDKLKDPAVIVIDEKAQYIIPLASGHAGGANGLSRMLAKHLRAVPVITTATDVEGVFSVDEFAVDNGLEIKNRDSIKKVAKKLLDGKTVSIAFEDDVIVETASTYYENSESESSSDEALYLLMRPFVVGMGCRKGKKFEEVEEYFLSTLKTLNISVKDVTALATIDVKKDEEAFIKLCEKYGMKFMIYTAKDLNDVQGEFEESAFVENTVGVSDVSARAAKKCGRDGRFVLKKEKKDGMTISVFEKTRRVNLRYE